MTMAQFDRWLLRQQGPGRRVRLFCFPYAGANASVYMPWQSEVSSSIEICAIQLPGRGKRYRDVPCTSFEPMIETLAQTIQEQPYLPFAFFGHSMGGLLAFEVARYFKRYHLPMPRKLIISGCAAPRYRGFPTKLHLLDDHALIEVLKDFNGTPREVMENRELMQLLLPAVRSDFALLYDYRYHPAPVLDLPLSVLAGRSDGHTSVEQVRGWEEETTGACSPHWFDGDHFFIHSNSNAVVRFVNKELGELLENPPLLTRFA
jgi:surfactin synthase thioesterase subunit